MKCRITCVLHIIWVFTVCQSIRLRVSGPEIIKKCLSKRNGRCLAFYCLICESLKHSVLGVTILKKTKFVMYECQNNFYFLFIYNVNELRDPSQSHHSALPNL